MNKLGKKFSESLLKDWIIGKHLSENWKIRLLLIYKKLLPPTKSFELFDISPMASWAEDAILAFCSPLVEKN